MTLKEFAKKIDFKLLRPQKRLLLGLLHDDRKRSWIL